MRTTPETGHPVYTLTRARTQVAEMFARQGIQVEPGEVRDVEDEINAHLAVPMFRAAKELERNPVELAVELAPQLDLAETLFESVSAARGYVNLLFHPVRFSRAVFRDFAIEPDGYGRSTMGKGKTIVIDFSSPNIAKPFSVGHLRSTVIGQSLRNMLSWLGYFVVGDNHLGDWGTQFGKLLAAWELWGSEQALSRNPTRHLLDLYVRFHDDVKVNPEIGNRARSWFRRLESKDPDAESVWQRFVDHSRDEFQRIYDMLGVSFDSTLGESFYSDRLDGVVERALGNGVAAEEKPLEPMRSGDDEVLGDERVVLIPLGQRGIDTPLILRKSDGTSLYATREIATFEYRVSTWQPERILYVVGNEQQLYFRQFAVALRLLGHETPVVHVSFGLIRLPEGRMSTREGRVVLLEDVLKEGIRRAREIVEDRDMPTEEKDELARVVGLGAIRYADLSQNRTKDVVFDWDRILALDGDSAPYLQYAHTRCRSILRKANPDLLKAKPDPSVLATPEELGLLRQLARFPGTVAGAAEAYEPHRIANRIYRLAQDFSVFYNRIPVLNADTPQLQRARLALVHMTASTLRIGLRLLGIEVPERM